MRPLGSVSRRAFLQSSGLFVGFSLFTPLGAVRAWAQERSLPGSLGRDPFLDSWIRVGPDGMVTLLTGKVEIGQGIATALAQIAADELDVALERIRVLTADTDETPNEGYTSGSNSVEQSGTAIRHAAAEARAILLERAAERLGAPASALRVEDGRISGPRNRSATYWELIGRDTLHRRATGAVPPKDPGDARYVGKPIPRLDIPGKVFAEPSYVQDVRRPGMLHGRIVRPPSYGARLDAVDESAAAGMPGVVKIVRDGSFLGVVAEREEQAIAAAERLAESARWSGAASLPSSDELDSVLLTARADNEVVSEKRDPRAPRAVTTLEATYSKPYIAHASIGPSCAVAEEVAGRMTIWTHSQGVYPLRAAVARLLGVSEERLRLVHVDGAGCYGHNGADDVAADAALLARALPGRPVRVQWMREDEHAGEPFGSAMVIKVRGGLDEKGGIVDWSYDVWSCAHSTRPNASRTTLLAGAYLATPPPGAGLTTGSSGGVDRNAVPIYSFPNERVVKHFVSDLPVRVSALRSLGAFANVFALESFMDELAAAAEADPLEFRLRHLSDRRGREVLETVAEKSGWSARRAARGAAGGVARGRGFGFARYKNTGSYTAVAAEVMVDPQSGAIRFERAFAAVDAGRVINPDGLRNQIEGGIVQSTSWTLKESVQLDRDRVTSLDWSTYPVLTFSEIPEVEVALIDRPGEAALGVGETAQGPTAAAIANAVFDAAGIRLRKLPMTPERVLGALAAPSPTASRDLPG